MHPRGAGAFISFQVVWGLHGLSRVFLARSTLSLTGISSCSLQPGHPGCYEQKAGEARDYAMGDAGGWAVEIVV